MAEPPAATRFAAGRLRRFELLVVLAVALFVGGMALASVLFGAGDLLERLGRISGTTVLGLLALALVNYALRAWRWQIFSVHLGIAVPPLRGLLYYGAGLSMGPTPGKVGEALRLWLLERGHGYRYERLAPLFLGDRLGDLNAALLLCLIGVAGVPDGLVWTVAAALLVLAVTLAFVFPRPLIALVTLGYRALGRRGRRLFARTRTMLRLTARLFDPRLYALVLFLSVAGWFAEAVAFHWLLADLGATVPLLDAVFVFTFSLVVGALSMLPGGLGSTEATMVALLLALGVDIDTALVATAAIRAATLWFGVALGFALLPFALRSARRGGAAAPAIAMARR